jgi:hypothetical protein
MFRNILKSKHAHFVFMLGLLSITITTIKYLSLKVFLFHFLLFLYLIATIDCNIYGRCYSSVYITHIFAIIITTFLIFDYLGIFKPYKQAIKRLFKLYEKSNNSGVEEHLKKIMFPKDNEITNIYKRRTLPKIINKDFIHSNDHDFSE